MPFVALAEVAALTLAAAVAEVAVAQILIAETRRLLVAFEVQVAVVELPGRVAWLRQLLTV
ncbi:MAG: hypothetical protein CMM54_00625 [Rhodospirillaceae bacterium]|nr:hypothetical protein [Rhodospirillaceae bacterium]MBI05465.1 hypothetical protein [Rhodospirillaceae bacterium]